MRFAILPLLALGSLALPMEEPASDCDNLSAVLGNMGQLQGTIQGGVILGRPPRGTPAAPIAQALFQALRAATNSLTAASEAACPYDNSPIAANTCTLLTRAAADVATVVSLMSDLSKAEGGDDLDLDVLQEVADDSRDRMALALGGLTKTAQCPPVT